MWNRVNTSGTATPNREWRSHTSLLLILCLIAGPQGVCLGQTPGASSTKSTAAARPAVVDSGWPRVYTLGDATVAVHQPQVDEWKEFVLLSARSAVEIVPQKGAQKIIAAVHWEARTDTNFESRTVTLGEIRFTSFRAPGQSEAELKSLEALVTAALPKERDAIAVDRILAYLEPARVTNRQIEVSRAAPPMLVSTSPAILVMIDGKEILGEITGTNLTYVVNTNWDILKEKDKASFYLLNNKQWLTAESLAGPWKAAPKLPKDMAKIPSDDNWADLKKALPLSASNSSIKAPWVYVTNEPAEMILLKGEAQFTPISGTQLSEVANTESMLFFHNQERKYYFLTSGRWFRNAQLRGNWEYASDSLPADFGQIPPTHRKAAVRASVPGTIEASDAVLLASVPQMATVSRQEAAAQAKVTYVGEPQFQPIAKTELQYAVNTPADVIRHQDKYYLLQEGVWFVSSSPGGPWAVADFVPQEIYKIPPESPKHNTTYVYVTESDKSTVTTAQTAGYLGLMIGVGIGVAVWGTGYYYPPYYYYGPMFPHPVYWGYPYHSYGAAAWYNPATGFYGRAATAYGPYGGFGRSAAYNPATGSYVRRAGAYGPYQAAMGASFYNPRTGAWGGGYRYANPYQGWGEGVVRRGDQWAKSGYYYDSRGAVGGIRTSEGGRLVVASDGSSRGFVGRTSDGDLYAGKDGNIYRRDENGNWQQHGSGGWSNVNYDSLSPQQQQRVDQAKAKAPPQVSATQGQAPAGPANRAAQPRAASTDAAQPATSNRGVQPRPMTAATQPAAVTPTAQPRVTPQAAPMSRDTMSGLDRDARARERGNSNYGSWQSRWGGGRAARRR